MKKIMYMFVSIIATAMLVGCGDTIDGSNENDSELNNQENEEIEENEANAEDGNSEENAEKNTELNESNDESNDESKEENLTEEENAIEEELEPLYELASDHTVRPIADAPEKVVLFTIDDAPDKHGDEMAKILKDLDVGAIFFVNGHFIQSDIGREQLIKIHELGFEIGNHTMTHANLSNLSEEEQYQEIVQLNDLIEEITGERPRFFRAPFGVNTDYSKQLIAEKDMQWMNWSYGYDYFSEYMETEALGKIMVETNLLRNGANLLMHDREFTKNALITIVEGLREKGYEMVDPATIK